MTSGHHLVQSPLKAGLTSEYYPAHNVLARHARDSFSIVLFRIHSVISHFLRENRKTDKRCKLKEFGELLDETTEV